MTAQEMFEALGYEFSQTDRSISYEDPGSDEKHFIFYTDSKVVGIGAYSISIAEFKAMNQQMKELGWLDE